MCERTVEETLLKPPVEFDFPFPPYSIQEDFMKNLYETLENGKLGVFESPTGTGKSMSIICGALKWLYDAKQREVDDLKKRIAKMDAEIKMNADTDDWLDSHFKQAKARDTKFLAHKKLETINAAIEKVQTIIENGRKIKKGIIDDNMKKKAQKTNSNNVQNDEEDDDSLVVGNDEAANCEDEQEDSEEIVENKYVCPKIFICSRTHSQLSQLAGEIKKSPYSALGVRVVPLASRLNMCVNENVLRFKNLSIINEACQDLRARRSNTTKSSKAGERLKKLKTSGGCPFTSEMNMEVLESDCLSGVMDIEQLVTSGKSYSACPYYTTRKAVEHAQVVLVPYNTLLHPQTRAASGISLENSVVIVDEAHNLLETLANIHSATVTGLQVCHSHSYLVQYRDRYRDKFSSINLLHLNQLIFVLQKFVKLLKPDKEHSSVSRLTNFLMDAGIDNINLLTLLAFAERNRLSQKLRGYLLKCQPSVNLPQATKPQAGLSSFLKNITNKSKGVAEEVKPVVVTNEAPVGNPIPVVLSFLSALTNHAEDGRVVTTVNKTPSQSTLKFLLLNPAAHFQDIVQQARSVIVAGGTMQPFSEFTNQLFLLAGADSKRVVTFTCDHVVPPSNILPITVAQGPTARTFDFSYNNRTNPELLDELGRLLVNACNVIPSGMVVFFGSYDYEQLVYKHFSDTGVIGRIEKKKKVLREPRQSNAVDKVLAEYAAAAQSGALLFSVVGGKLSEGLNFNDHLGRCVVVVGLPYPNKNSPELTEKMAYLDQKIGGGSGSIFYENLCMKAVNQCIGRSVRHINDYAAVLLVDARYSRSHIQAALPNWIRKSLQVQPLYPPIQPALARFFSSKPKN